MPTGRTHRIWIAEEADDQPDRCGQRHDQAHEQQDLHGTHFPQLLDCIWIGIFGISLKFRRHIIDGFAQLSQPMQTQCSDHPHDDEEWHQHEHTPCDGTVALGESSHICAHQRANIPQQQEQPEAAKDGNGKKRIFHGGVRKRQCGNANQQPCQPPRLRILHSSNYDQQRKARHIDVITHEPRIIDKSGRHCQQQCHRERTPAPQMVTHSIGHGDHRQPHQRGQQAHGVIIDAIIRYP